MGQYFKFINFDKKEILSPYDYDNLAKVMEHSYQGNKFMSAVEKLLKTEWKGDRVLYIGDYVDEYYNDPKVKDTLKELLDETKPSSNNLYFLEYPSKKIEISKEELISTRYLYNHQTKEYVDLKEQPIQWSGYDKEDNCIYGAKIHPLSILLCASNGSGGSYYGTNMDYVGDWVNSLGHIEISDTELDYSYTKLNIVFDEMKFNKSNIEILKDTIEDNINKNRILDVNTLVFDDCLFLNKEEKETLYEFCKECYEKNYEEPEYEL